LAPLAEGAEMTDGESVNLVKRQLAETQMDSRKKLATAKHAR
jgi:hypothetical protein